MLIITSREFRENQDSYFDRVDKGEELIVQRTKNKAYRIVSVKLDDSLMSKEDFLTIVDKSLMQAKEGKIYSMLEGESLDDFLDRIAADVQD
ncbi:type II toxin-antitoxin system Phd/YefM family antitoxin [Sphingobacterium kyonggiense]